MFILFQYSHQTAQSVTRRIAWLFGVAWPWWPVRYLWMIAMFVAVYYVAATCGQAWLSILALGFGYVGVWSVWRTWANDEERRRKIARKMIDDEPDRQPDFRGMAALAALQLLGLFPLLFQALDGVFDLYTVPHDASLWTWLALTLDSVGKCLADFCEIYQLQLTTFD